MVRVAGSYTSVAMALLAVFHEYGWHRMVLLSDMEDGSFCSYSSTDIYNYLSTVSVWNMTVYWIHMHTDATADDIVEYLSRARSLGRGRHQNRLLAC
jgi:hypothetical protein